MQKIVDYHIHTALCQHAFGTMDEYVEQAIKLGLAEIGFSDHGPLPFPKSDGISMRVDQFPEYIRRVKELESKYSIPVKLGLELDYPVPETVDMKLIERSLN